MRKMQKLLKVLGVFVLVSCALAAVAIYRIPEIQWRAQVVSHKLQGKIPELTLAEVLLWLRPGSPVYLEGLADNPVTFVSIDNSLSGPAATEAGSELYFERCAKCHGESGEGAAGPALVNLQESASDWALFRTIQNGIPNTAMQSQGLDEKQTWQVVTFLRSIGLTTSTADSTDATLIDTFDSGPIDLTATMDDWKSFTGSYFGWRYSGLDQITPENVQLLGLAWLYQMDTDVPMVETTPIVVDGTMYVTQPPNKVIAIDALSGDEIWTFEHQLSEQLVLCCGAVNRGVAIQGSTVFLGTLDAHLVAIDASTGKLKWDKELASAERGYSITSAPLVADGKVITGIAGGEFGISGFVTALNQETGEEEWRYNTVPAAGEPFSETWAGGLETGGVPTWGTGTYDPELGLVYWGAGHPAPDFNGDGREGDNLPSNSLLALSVKNGALKWHFQFTPHDEWDWDTTQVPILLDREVDGKRRRLVLTANRNGFYYVLDRSSGEFIAGKAFVKQTWADGLDEQGRPVVLSESRPSEQGTLVYPGVTGGTNWWPPSYSATADLFLVPFLEKANIFFKWEQSYRQGEEFLGGIAKPIGGDYTHFTGVRALDPVSGDRIWELRFPERGGWSQVGGVLSTVSGLLFVGDYMTFYAVDAQSGTVLWEVPVGGGINAAPATYRVGGHQFVSLAAGKVILTFALTGEAAAIDNSVLKPAAGKSPTNGRNGITVH